MSQKLRKNTNLNGLILTSSQIEVKNVYLASERLKEKEKLDKQLVEIQEKLKKLDSV